MGEKFSQWYRCPFCGKKLLMVEGTTVVSNLPMKCKLCHRTFLVYINAEALINNVSDSDTDTKSGADSRIYDKQ